MFICRSYLPSIFLIILLYASSSWSKSYSLDEVIHLALKQSYTQKIIKNKHHSDDLILADALAPYDWAVRWSLNSPKYTLDQLDDLSWAPLFTLQKKWNYGTVARAVYSSQKVSSVKLPSSIPAGLSSSFPRYQLSLQVEQNLLNNFLGKNDQSQLKSIYLRREILSLARKEEMKNLILTAAEMFWESYTAKQNLKNTRKRVTDYKKLLKVAQNKLALGYTKPAEIPQIKAQFEKAILEEKQIQVQLNNANIKLQSLLQLPSSRIRFRQHRPKTLPKNMSPKWADSLSAAQINQKTYESELSQVQAKETSFLPDLNLQVSANYYTNTDYTSSMSFISNIPSQAKKNYGISLNLTYLIPSSSWRWNRWDKMRIKKIQLETEYLDKKQNLKNQLQISLNNLKIFFKSLNSINRIAKLQKKTVEEIKEAYSQGRADIHALISIQDQDRSIELQKIEVQKLYNLSLLRYYSFRDQLLDQYL